MTFQRKGQRSQRAERYAATSGRDSHARQKAFASQVNDDTFHRPPSRSDKQGQYCKAVNPSCKASFPCNSILRYLKCNVLFKRTPSCSCHSNPGFYQCVYFFFLLNFVYPNKFRRLLDVTLTLSHPHHLTLQKCNSRRLRPAKETLY